MTNFLMPAKRVKVFPVLIFFGQNTQCAWLQPDKWLSCVTADDVSNAIKSQNIQAPVGSIGTRPTA